MASSSNSGKRVNATKQSEQKATLTCYHDILATYQRCNRPPNKGRKFYRCPLWKRNRRLTVRHLFNISWDRNPSQLPPTEERRFLVVLLRSLYQGPKIDVWSAGVTLLYLITGKLPFTGDPEQNMKDIVKIRGNEDLWEVVKLHNRESSFPVATITAGSFGCKIPSIHEHKRVVFSKHKETRFPRGNLGSLFDLIEKCLTVNPRLRISADEALRHEFFTPCHEALQKQRSMRRGPILDSTTNTSPLVRESGSVKSVRAVTPVKKIQNSSLAI
ncbi:hypothetical protein Cgig2_019889 [Carnegiea gigantea]|uniref:non-specific serine/threonine protein kinase n=1 Tax=Carnegiea gigantea TaxID=171969 RepID=A0A9Q1QJY7_9CARY|nr:hypothetical protein Cgig2_019889 [Carnegiea gigantea]